MIAIVDDNEAVREATASLMRSAGYVTRTFASARSFLNSSCVGITQLLIADVQMPGVSGFELHEKLGEAGANIPTILITARPDARSHARAIATGVLRYLTKPFDGSELLEVIQSALPTKS